MIKQVQAEHAADPTRMPTALTNYDAIQVATAKLTVHPQYSPQVLNLQELKNCINQIERSGKLTIMTLVSRDYPGHTFLIDGRSRMGDLWLYDSHLPALLTRIDSARFEETLYQYTLSKLVQIINYRPDFRDPTSFFLEAVTLEEVSTMAKADR